MNRTLLRVILIARCGVSIAFVAMLSAITPSTGALVQPFGRFAAVDGVLALATAACAVAVPALGRSFAAVAAADGLLEVAAATMVWLGPGIPDFGITLVLFVGLAAVFAFYVGLLQVAEARRLQRRLGRNPVSVALALAGAASVAFGVALFLARPEPELSRWMLMTVVVIKGLALLAIALRQWPNARGESAAAMAATLIVAATTAGACARGPAPSVAPRVALSDTSEARDAAEASAPSDTNRTRLDRVGDAFGRLASALRLSRHTPPPYTGTDARGIPRYARRAFTAEERQLLREVYGVENPQRLYVSDSADDGLLKYDTRVKRCRRCYVSSHRIGLVSVRRPGESWEQAERRVRAMRRRDFSAAARAGESRAVADLDPDVRSDVERMLADARRAGFAVRVVATYRSPEHEAYLFAMGGGRTFTLTSLHSYGRAIDVVIGDGNLRRKATRAQWVAFRRWVIAYKGDTFRILGTPERTWDWRHVEMPTASIGFRTIDEAVARARACAGDGGTVTPTSRRPHSRCDFVPNLPARVARARD